MQIITRSEAKAQGLKRYFTGKPCPQGHVVDKLVSNKTCCRCAAIKYSIWKVNNPERVRAKSREWANAKYHKDPKKACAKVKAWYSANKDKVRKEHKERYWRNPEKYRAAALEAKRANPSKAKAQQQRSYYEGPLNPKGDSQWLSKAKIIKRTLRRLLKSSNPDLSHLRKLDPSL